jgi:hypothetical protein
VKGESTASLTQEILALVLEATRDKVPNVRFTAAQVGREGGREGGREVKYLPVPWTAMEVSWGEEEEEDEEGREQGRDGKRFCRD